MEIAEPITQLSPSYGANIITKELAVICANSIVMNYDVSFRDILDEHVHSEIIKFFSYVGKSYLNPPCWLLISLLFVKNVKWNKKWKKMELF